MNLVRNRFAWAASVLAASFAFPVLADPPAKGGVGGPPVNDSAQQGNGEFAKGGEGKGRAGPDAADRRQVEVWRRAFMSLESSFTAEQREQIKAIRTDHEAKLKAWRTANGEKERALQEQIRKSIDAARAKGETAPPADGKQPADAMPPAGGKPQGEGRNRPRPDPALVKQMQELRSTMPKAEDVQAKLWVVLTADQQAAFKKSYDSLAQEAGRGGPRRRGGGEGDMGGSTNSGAGEGGGRPAKRPPAGKPFQFEDGVPAQPPTKPGNPANS